MAAAALLVPWRASNPIRARNLEVVRRWYAPLGWPLTLADSGQYPFNRAASRNRAAALAGDWDVAVFLDADTLVALGPLLDGIELALAGEDRVILPHDDYHGLSREATIRFIEEGPATVVRGLAVNLARPNHRKAPAPLGVLVISRAGWERIGGFEERMVGWGHEDYAFLEAGRRLLGNEVRLPGALVHLWHPTEIVQPAALEGNRQLRQALLAQ